MSVIFLLNFFYVNIFNFRNRIRDLFFIIIFKDKKSNKNNFNMLLISIIELIILQNGLLLINLNATLFTKKPLVVR